MMTIAAHTPPTILLLHDDPALSTWLTAHGCQPIRSAPSDVAATLAAATLAATPPALIWLDAAQGGLDVLALVRAACVTAGVPDLPILMVVPPLSPVIEMAYDAGASDVIAASDPEIVRARRLSAWIAAHQRQTDAEQIARSLRRQWEQVFMRNPAIALLIDANSSEIVDANTAAVRFYGYSIEQLRALHLRHLEATGDLVPMQGSLRTYAHKLANGQVRDVKIFASPLDMDARNLIFMIVFDNTKRREAETAEIYQRNFAEALRHTAAALTSTLDLDGVLDRILQQIAQAIPHDSANIMLVKDGIARMVRWRGYAPRTADADLAALRISIDDYTNFRYSALTRQPLAIPDVTRYPGWHIIPSTAWIKSYMCAPIRVGERVIGFLNLDSAKVGRFSQADAERLQALADQAAVALRNASLYRRIKRQAKWLEQRVRERTAELEAERKQLRVILDAMTEGVAFIDTERPDQRAVRYVNRALVEMTGYSPDEWRQYSLALFQSDGQSDDDFAQETPQVYAGLERGETYTSTYRMRRKDGSAFDAFETASPILDAGRALLGAVSVIRDISREKALEQERVNFVAHASHELRTPIANLKTRLYLMRKQPDKLYEHMAVIEDVASKMQRLVDDLLSISRFQRGAIQLTRRPVVLQALIDHIVMTQKPEAERKGQTLIVESASTPIWVDGDAERLNQVVTNLVTNAINYTPTNGTITVCAALERRADHASMNGAVLNAASAHSDSSASPLGGVITVLDTGVGIAPDHLPYIFQPFYRVASSVPGTGLGLSIAYQIVELHAGTLDVVSEVGKGSQFRVWLPLVEGLDYERTRSAETG
jgi:PAS domain S-box-containing protein